MEEGPPAKKKRKKDIEETLLIYHPDVSIRLTAEYAAKLEVQDPTFLTVDKLEYILWNSDTCSYLYSICALMFEVKVHGLTLLKSPYGNYISEDPQEWEVMEGDSPIQKGNYIVRFEETEYKDSLYLSSIVYAYRLRCRISNCMPPKSKIVQEPLLCRGRQLQNKPLLYLVKIPQ